MMDVMVFDCGWCQLSPAMVCDIGCLFLWVCVAARAGCTQSMMIKPG